MAMGSRISVFYGTRADEVLSAYRRSWDVEKRIRFLDSSLAELIQSRDAYRDEHSGEIARRESRVAEARRDLEEKRRQRDELRGVRNELAHRIDSLWKRMGIAIKASFSRTASTVKEIRGRLEALPRQIEKAEDETDEASRILNGSVRELRQLTDPLDSLEYSVGYLEARREGADRETSNLSDAIDAVIQDTAKTNAPEILRRKFTALAAYSDEKDFGRKILRLKDTITRLCMLRPLARPEDMQGEAIRADADEALRAITAAVREGMYTESSRGRSDVSVSGTGETRVRRTRTRTETYTDAKGRMRTRTRTESYWKTVSVHFSGSVDASFSIQFGRWRKAPLIDALRDLSDTWFRVGGNRVRSGPVKEIVTKLEQNAQALTRAIRAEIERDFTA
jgi:hypothetical protein